MNPENLDKYLYIEKTPTWFVRFLYTFAILSWFLVIYGFSGAISIDPFFRWFVGPILGIITIYHLISFGLNLLYRQFDLPKHLLLQKNFWSVDRAEPSVDIFLPICGEDMEVLRNTWEHVSRLRYQDKRTYVLDDSKEECLEHEKLANDYGFTYFARPNKGEMKKAGNLKYAYERTESDFIAIFDADFAPHPDFLHELLPYTSDPKVGIVQSPQYFEATAATYKKSPLSYVAAYQEEHFYRITQVARDTVDGAICCGSNAIYRREALKTIGGPRQVDASEDSRTGFALLCKGWVTRYVPVILAVGICPDNTYAYYHQQHRWCRGRSELVLSKEFITAPVPFMAKMCNISGFLSFLMQPLEILLSFQLFWTLFFYNQYISISGASIFYPYMFFAIILLPLTHIIRFKKEVFFASFVKTYASAHSILSVFMGRSVGWIPTNAKHLNVSSAFRQTLWVVGGYIFAYLGLTALSIRYGLLHLLDYNYYSVQFWIFFNLLLACTLLWAMYKKVSEVRGAQVEGGALSRISLAIWRIKTLGLYLIFLVVSFCAIAYL